MRQPPQNDSGANSSSIGENSCGVERAIAFNALAGKGISFRAITTSEIKISILIDGPYAELAVRTLHAVYGLDKG